MKYRIQTRLDDDGQWYFAEYQRQDGSWDRLVGGICRSKENILALIEETKNFPSAESVAAENAKLAKEIY